MSRRFMHRAVGVIIALLVLTLPTVTLAAPADDAIRRLRQHVPPALAGTCERLAARDMDVGVREAAAALVCYPGGNIEDVGLYLFHDPERLDQWWDERLAMLDEPLGPGDCSEGVQGIEAALVGEVACYRSRGVARIRWIDRERLLYGSVDTTRRDVEAAFEWWLANVAGSDAPNEAIGAPQPGPLVTWQRVDRAPGFGTGTDLSTALLDGVATSAGGDSVAVGHVIDEPVAWHSTDGAEWREVVMPGSSFGCHTCTPSGPGDPGIPSDVAAWGEGFVAIGSSPAEEGSYGLVWLSEAGTEWAKPVEIGDATFERLIVTPEGLAIIGVADPKPGREWRGRPTVWASTDGQTWEAHTIDERRGRAEELARSPAGVWLARGARLWRSEEEGSWVELVVPQQDADGRRLRLSGPVWTPTGFVLAVAASDRWRQSSPGVWYSSDDVRSELWHSLDGLTWTVVAMTDASIQALASGALGSVGFTTPPTDRDNALQDVPPVVLTSMDGQTWCHSEHEAFSVSAVRRGDVGPEGRVLAAGYREHLWGGPVIWWGTPAGSDKTACQPAQLVDDGPVVITLEPASS